MRRLDSSSLRVINEQEKTELKLLTQETENESVGVVQAQANIASRLLKYTPFMRSFCCIFLSLILPSFLIPIFFHLFTVVIGMVWLYISF